MDSGATARGGVLRQHPEDALHAGVRAIPHPQGDALRQRPGEVRPASRPQGSRADRAGGEAGLGPLLPLGTRREPAQQADQGPSEVCGSTGGVDEAGAAAEDDAEAGVQVVVGVLQEALDHIAAL